MKALTREFVLGEVKSLQSENGENGEYDRALYDLAGSLLIKEGEFVTEAARRIKEELK